MAKAYWDWNKEISVPESEVETRLNKVLTLISDKSVGWLEPWKLIKKDNERFREFVINNWSAPNPNCQEDRVSPDGLWRSEVLETGIIKFIPYTETHYKHKRVDLGKGAYTCKRILV